MSRRNWVRRSVPPKRRLRASFRPRPCIRRNTVTSLRKARCLQNAATKLKEGPPNESEGEIARDSRRRGLRRPPPVAGAAFLLVARSRARTPCAPGRERRTVPVRPPSVRGAAAPLPPRRRPRGGLPVRVSAFGRGAGEVGECVHTELPVADPSAQAESLPGACSRLLGPVLCQCELGEVGARVGLPPRESLLGGDRGAPFEQGHGLIGVSLHSSEVAERADRLQLALAEAVAAKDRQTLLERRPGAGRLA